MTASSRPGVARGEDLHRDGVHTGYRGVRIGAQERAGQPLPRRQQLRDRADLDVPFGGEALERGQGVHRDLRARVDEAEFGQVPADRRDQLGRDAQHLGGGVETLVLRRIRL